MLPDLSSSSSTPKESQMPKPTEIVAALADVSAIDSCETLRAEIVDLFTMLSDLMKDWNDERPALIMQKMATTVGSIPYEVLAEFGHNYNPTLLTLVIYLRITSAAGIEVGRLRKRPRFPSRYAG
jgi:hypothetical protein